MEPGQGEQCSEELCWNGQRHHSSRASYTLAPALMTSGLCGFDCGICGKDSHRLTAERNFQPLPSLFRCVSRPSTPSRRFIPPTDPCHQVRHTVGSRVGPRSAPAAGTPHPPGSPCPSRARTALHRPGMRLPLTARDAPHSRYLHPHGCAFATLPAGEPGATAAMRGAGAVSGTAVGQKFPGRRGRGPAVLTSFLVARPQARAVLRAEGPRGGHDGSRWGTEGAGGSSRRAWG